MTSAATILHLHGMANEWHDRLAATPAYLPAPDAPIRYGAGMRTAEQLTSIVDQFDVANNKRYLPKDGATFCNIFVWDVCAALGCPAPHWVTRERRAPGAPGKPRLELSANDLILWLRAEGQTPGMGWKATNSRDQSRRIAGLGCPVIAAWLNPTGHGHVAMVLPSPGTDILIAQAGGTNHARCTLEEGFGRRDVEFFFHG